MLSGRVGRATGEGFFTYDDHDEGPPDDARRHLPGARRGRGRGAPEPELAGADDAVVRVEATGICGSDLHIYHGRVPVEKGFTIGHEFVGTVIAAGDEVERVALGDRVLGTFVTACATCTPCIRGDYHSCTHGRTFGHGPNLGDLQGAQAEQLLVPHANLTLRRVRRGCRPTSRCSPAT